MAARGGGTKYHSFIQYKADTEAAEYGRARRRVRAKVSDRATFVRQKQYLMSLYEGLEVAHSFVDDNGQTFDCVPIEQQPALRRSGAPLAQPPILPRPTAPLLSPNTPPPPLRAGRTDRFGNAMQCPPGTVPIRRVPLEELNRFETLEDYFRKPRLSPRHSTPLAPGVVNAPAHPHAYAFQDVPNLGAHTILSVWSPTVGGDQIFSLSQQWCVALGPAGAQTVEAGWQVYPLMYQHDQPVLFAYWSSNNYQQGAYDYNNFVQYGSSHALGMAFESVSAAGGPQVEIELSFLLTQGNWWLFLNGIDQQHAIGYFPTSLFAGGPLATGATRIEFGGETSGYASFPPMGSGAFAAGGAGHAACHRALHYFSTADTMVPAALTPLQEWPAAYTIDLQAQAGADPQFFFGGPGGIAAAGV